MTRAPTVQILGVDPANKGACLMLIAAQRELADRFPGARFAMDFTTTPVEARLRYGLWAAAPARSPRGAPMSRLGRLAPAGLRRKLGVVTDDEIDVVLDASGFAYGDFWGAAKFDRRVGRPSIAWRRDGKAVAFLPQAWGPFSDAGFAHAVAEALGRADIVFARDDASFAHLRAAGAQGVRQAPDFTNLLAPRPTPETEAHRGAGVLIPNAKMLEARGEDAREGYLRFLEAAAATLRDCAGETLILIHEGAGDRRIADELGGRLDAPPPILEIEDPLEAKALLAGAGAVISSRFHGLVSALSCGAPSLACGWSHKYEALMADYDCPELSVSLSDEAGWRALLDRFGAAVKHGDLRATVLAAAVREKAKSAAMWDAVEETLRVRLARRGV